jgi:hypothetical protein
VIHTYEHNTYDFGLQGPDLSQGFEPEVRLRTAIPCPDG